MTEVAVRALCGARRAALAGEIGARFERSQPHLESPALRQLPHPIPFRSGRVRADRRALDALIGTGFDTMAASRAWTLWWATLATGLLAACAQR